MSDLPLPEARPDIDAIRERCEAATPGPWEFVEDAWRIEHGPVEIIDDPEGPWPYREAILDSCFGPSMPEADWAFVAAARSDIPALLAYVETLESGHRVVWSAEEVAPLIEALTEMVAAFADDFYPTAYDYEREMADPDRTDLAWLAARAALAHVRGPEPDECPRCHGRGIENYIIEPEDLGATRPCTHAWHRGRVARKRVSE